jgi:hypothetical protein
MPQTLRSLRFALLHFLYCHVGSEPAAFIFPLFTSLQAFVVRKPKSICPRFSDLAWTGLISTFREFPKGGSMRFWVIHVDWWGLGRNFYFLILPFSFLLIRFHLTRSPFTPNLFRPCKTPAKSHGIRRNSGQARFAWGERKRDGVSRTQNVGFPLFCFTKHEPRSRSSGLSLHVTTKSRVDRAAVDNLPKTALTKINMPRCPIPRRLGNTTNPCGGAGGATSASFLAQAKSITANSLDVETGRMQRWIEGHEKVIEKSSLTEKRRYNIGCESSFDVHHVLSNHKLYVVIVNRSDRSR